MSLGVEITVATAGVGNAFEVPEIDLKQQPTDEPNDPCAAAFREHDGMSCGPASEKNLSGLIMMNTCGFQGSTC